jgi:hypothetical protein
MISFRLPVCMCVNAPGVAGSPVSVSKVTLTRPVAGEGAILGTDRGDRACGAVAARLIVAG